MAIQSVPFRHRIDEDPVIESHVDLAKELIPTESFVVPDHHSQRPTVEFTSGHVVLQSQSRDTVTVLATNNAKYHSF